MSSKKLANRKYPVRVRRGEVGRGIARGKLQYGAIIVVERRGAWRLWLFDPVSGTRPQAVLSREL